MKSEINQVGEGLYVATVRPGTAVAFEMFKEPGNAEVLGTFENKPSPVTKKDIKFAPWGRDNKLPNTLMSLLYNNNLAPGTLDTKDQITIGDQLVFYYKSYVGGTVTPTLFQADDLYDWLEDIEAETYLEECVIDWNWFSNFFACLYTGKGSQKDKIVKIKAIEAIDTRCSIIDPKSKRIEKYGVSDWNGRNGDVDIIDAFEPGGKIYERMVYHGKKKSPGNPYYPLPSWIGAQYWLRHANKIPVWKSANMDNSINIKYHIQFPEKYFTNLYPSPEFSRADRQKKVEEKVQEISDHLAGVENVAKAFTTQYAVDAMTGKELPGWKIEPIKNEINHEAYSKDFEDSNSAILSALGTDPSLSGVMMVGKMGGAGGSEKRIAYEFHSKVKTRFARKLLLYPIQAAMKINGLHRRKVDGEMRNIYCGIQDVQFTTLDKNPTGSEKVMI